MGLKIALDYKPVLDAVLMGPNLQELPHPEHLTGKYYSLTNFFILCDLHVQTFTWVVLE